MNQFTPGSVGDPTATVEISISCRDLLDLDVFSRSDPMCVVYHQPEGTSDCWVELLRTEIIWDCLNPEFTTKLTIDYRFEEEQALRFEVYDIDTPSANLDNHDFIGYAECTLGQIVASGYVGLTLPLIQKKSRYNPKVPKQVKQSHGKIVLLSEELVQFKEEVTLELKGYDMGSTRCCIFPPDIFYVLSKSNENGTFTVVYRSEVIEGDNLIWNPVTISMRSLCGADRDRRLQFQFFQVGFNGYHRSLGFVYTTVNELKSTFDDGNHELKLVGKNGVEKTSKIEIRTMKISPIYTFLEYISGGTQIHCCFAIDFTASNGNPNDSSTLHHISEAANRLNPYEQAIQAVGEIIQDYDQSKLFPVFGFGARIPPKGQISHNFPVTLIESPYCKGVEGVLEAYRKCIRQVQLYGPTNFAPIIKNVASMARQHLDGQDYYVLLIMTDGIITDMADTTEAIVEASSLPLSIIIIGVGSANFAAMDVLDGDTVRLSSHGKYAERDIVQFVPYRDAFTWMATVCPEVVGKWSSSQDGTSHLARVKLAKEVLAEIPDQLSSFMKSRQILPATKDSVKPRVFDNRAVTDPHLSKELLVNGMSDSSKSLINKTENEGDASSRLASNSKKFQSQIDHTKHEEMHGMNHMNGNSGTFSTMNIEFNRAVDS